MGKRHLRQGEREAPVTVLSGAGGLAGGAGARAPRGGQHRTRRGARRGARPGGGPAAVAGRQSRCLHGSEQGGLPLPPGLGRGGGTKASILMALLHPSAPFTQSQ